MAQAFSRLSRAACSSAKRPPMQKPRIATDVRPNSPSNVSSHPVTMADTLSSVRVRARLMHS